MSQPQRHPHPPLVIAIDGPAGSGKSSTSRGVARRLRLGYLDTGSLYRAIAWAMFDRGIDPTDREALIKLAGDVTLEVGTDPRCPTISVDGFDITSEIHDPQISAKVSIVATIQPIRDILTRQMREIIGDASAGIVAEGRDITTVVAPQAQVRVLLQADPAARIKRRERQLKGTIDQAALTDQVVRRDKDDAAVSEFVTPAPGVTLIDSTHINLDQVIETVIALVPAEYR